MSVKLRKKKNPSTGTTSLYLDIYNNGERRYEFLPHLKLTPATTPADRQKNKENLQLAKEIAIAKAQELTANDYHMSSTIGKKTLVTEWMQSYVDKYDKKDKRNMQGALNRFKEFLQKEKIHSLTFGRIDELIISAFQDKLIKDCKGEGASSYFSRFKKMMKHAYRAKLIQRNPATDVPTKQGRAKKKDVLTNDEIKLLYSTPASNNQVKNAFLFCCMTGLRWADVTDLYWRDIFYKEGYMVKKQTKTENDVHINLNKTALQLIGKPREADQKVFDLPTANGANKSIKAWVKDAGIKNKKITWHNARHSFGTNLIYHGADVTTASNLLGHSTLKHTQRYVKAANDLKQKATDALSID